MPKPRAKADQKCEPHKKVIYRSFYESIGGALFLAKKKGTARIYWEEICRCYHVTSQAKPLQVRGK